MTKPNDYTVQNGCWNCSHVFRLTDYDDPEELYCNSGNDPRPLCGSVSMKECFDVGHQPGYYNYEKNKSEWHKRFEAWKEWIKGRDVIESGVCGQWEAEKPE